MIMKTTIGFIGGGRITKIFREGFKNKINRNILFTVIG